MPMLDQIANQFLAMNAKSARNLVGSLSLHQKKGLSVFDQEGKVDDLEKPRVNTAALGYGMSGRNYDSKPFHFIDGIAVIPVTGTLLHKLGYSSSWATGYNVIVAMFDAANADPDVEGILLAINSPGGTVAGCFDATDHLYENKGDKPVWAIYDDMACSGAMCIGSVADRKLTTQTAMCGSIGVVQIHASYEDMIADSGMAVTLIYSGSHKVDGNPYKNLPDSVYEDFKEQCDTLRVQFAEKVARNTGLSLEEVLATEAETYTGQAAVDAGLADEVVNSHNIISYFKQHLSGSDSSTQRSVTMSEQTKNVAAEPVNTGEEAQAALATAVQAENVIDHQARCKAIITAEAAEGRKEMAHHLAFETNMPADDAIALLAKAPQQSATADHGNALDAAMASTEQPNITAMGEDSEQSEADQYVAAYKTVTGAK